jgi:signal transduction histidine kinase
MQQVLHNLVENALKYRATDRKPTIRIRAADSPDPQRVRIEVADNGIGFEQEFADRIFVLFERLHDRTSYSGTGLGLALCKRIVEQHHGTIEAYGVPEQGARFVFELPAA